MRKINWVKLWADFDAWYEKRAKGTKCSACGGRTHYAPEWDEQQRKIASLAEAQLKRR